MKTTDEILASGRIIAAATGFDGEVLPCYVMQHQTKWSAYTKWPVSAPSWVG